MPSIVSVPTASNEVVAIDHLIDGDKSPSKAIEFFTKLSYIINTRMPRATMIETCISGIENPGADAFAGLNKARTIISASVKLLARKNTQAI